MREVRGDACTTRTLPRHYRPLPPAQSDIISGVSGLVATYMPFTEIIALIKAAGDSVKFRILRPFPLLRYVGAGSAVPPGTGFSVTFLHAPTGVHTIGGFSSLPDAAAAFDELLLAACGTRAASSSNFHRHLAVRARCAAAVAQVAEVYGDAGAVRAALAQVRRLPVRSAQKHYQQYPPPPGRRATLASRLPARAPSR